MRTPISRTSGLLTTFGIVVAGAAVPTHAVNLFWNNASGGAASTASNWAPAQVPNPGDALFFSMNNTFDVSFNNTVAQSLLHSYSTGNVSLSIASTHTTQNFLIADNPGNAATVSLAPGTLSAILFRLGDDSTSNGTFNLSGFFSTVNSTTTIVGDDGIGTLEVAGGSDFNAGTLTVGHNATGSGTLTSTGAPLLLGNPQPSDVNATAAIIGDAGDGILDILAGARVDVAGDMFIAAQSGSTGTVEVDSGANPPNSVLTVGGNLHIAHNTTSAAAGTGTLTVLSSALVDVNGTTFLDDANGGVGTLVLNGNGQFITGSLAEGQVNGVLNLINGLLVIDGGAFDPPGTSIQIDSPTGANPVVELRNGAVLDNDGTGSINIGDGELSLTSGSTATISSVCSLGSNAGEIGTLRVADGAVYTGTGGIGGGGFGEGDIIVEAGGQIVCGGIVLGVNSTGLGILDVIGAKAHVDTETLEVGGDGHGTEGTGIVTVGDGGVLNVTESGFTVNTAVHPNGVIHVLEDGLLESEAAISLEGQLNMIGGTVNADSVSIYGELAGFGTVNAIVGFNFPGDAVINADGGTLTLGLTSSTGGFNGALGTLNVGDAIVTLRDSDGARLGITTIAGGTLNLPNGSELLQNIGNTIHFSGNGIVKGDWENEAVINSTGPGLNIQEGTLTSVNHAINGDVITFGSGGEFEGSGTIGCRVVGASGSLIKATGNLTMGNPSSPSGVSLTGTLDVGAHTVTLLDNSGVGLGTLTKLNGGTLIQSVNVFPGVGETLRGFGTIQTNLVNGGLVQPGGVNTIGTLTVTGTYVQNLGTGPGDLEVELASLASADRLVCNGAATLNGHLIVKPINGFVPVINQEFVVLTAPSISGNFDLVILQNAPSNLAAQAIISATQVKVKIIPNPCAGDIAPSGGNGVVDVDDLLAVINGWGACPTPPANCPGDIAPTGGNGVIDVDDLLTVINGWGGCP